VTAGLGGTLPAPHRHSPPTGLFNQWVSGDVFYPAGSPRGRKGIGKTPPHRCRGVWCCSVPLNRYRKACWIRRPK